MAILRFRYWLARGALPDSRCLPTPIRADPARKSVRAGESRPCRRVQADFLFARIRGLVPSEKPIRGNAGTRGRAYASRRRRFRPGSVFLSTCVPRGIRTWDIYRSCCPSSFSIIAEYMSESSKPSIPYSAGREIARAASIILDSRFRGNDGVGNGNDGAKTASGVAATIHSSLTESVLILISSPPARYVEDRAGAERTFLRRKPRR